MISLAWPARRLRFASPIDSPAGWLHQSGMKNANKCACMLVRARARRILAAACARARLDGTSLAPAELTESHRARRNDRTATDLSRLAGTLIARIQAHQTKLGQLAAPGGCLNQADQSDSHAPAEFDCFRRMRASRSTGRRKCPSVPGAFGERALRAD